MFTFQFRILQMARRLYQSLSLFLYLGGGGRGGAQSGTPSRGVNIVVDTHGARLGKIIRATKDWWYINGPKKRNKAALSFV